MEKINTLHLVYEESALLIPLLARIRDKKVLEKRNLKAVFDAMPLWEKEKTKNGHVKYKHCISGYTVSWQGHNGGRRGDSRIPHDHLQGILDSAQNHLNIFNNEIFQYRTRNWKTEPDYSTAMKRLHEWLARRGG